MRKTFGTAFVLAGLAFGVGSAQSPADGDRLFFVYSADERGELHPCG